MTRLWCMVMVFHLCCAMTAQAQSARDILKATGIQGGLVVHLGCGDGRLTAALRVGDGYLVHGLDTDAEKVAKAREFIRSQGLYGRVSVDTFQGRRLPYVDNLVNLVVASGECQAASEEIARVLAPNGVAMIRSSLVTRHSSLTTPASCSLEGWTKLIKPWPKEIDEWTHFLHGADNSAVARGMVLCDKILFVAGPPDLLGVAPAAEPQPN